MTNEEITNHPCASKDDNLKPLATSTSQQLRQDCGYYKAQQLLKTMLDEDLISLSEFNKITLLNRKRFSPFLAEIMPKTT